MWRLQSGAARATTSGWAMRQSPPTRSCCARSSTGHWHRNRPAWKICCAFWSRTASPFTGAARPSPSAQRAGATTSALTGWGTATRWTICWRSSPARKSIRPANSLPRRPPRSGSICWWTSRQNCRPGKVPGMPAGPRCSTSNRWRRPSTTCPNTGCWIMPIWKQKQQRQRPITMRCPTRSRPPRSAWPRLPCCAPTSSTTPRPARPM